MSSAIFELRDAVCAPTPSPLPVLSCLGRDHEVRVIRLICLLFAFTRFQIAPSTNHMRGGAARYSRRKRAGEQQQYRVSNGDFNKARQRKWAGMADRSKTDMNCSFITLLCRSKLLYCGSW